MTFWIIIGCYLSYSFRFNSWNSIMKVSLGFWKENRLTLLLVVAKTIGTGFLSLHQSNEIMCSLISLFKTINNFLGVPWNKIKILIHCPPPVRESPGNQIHKSGCAEFLWPFKAIPAEKGWPGSPLKDPPSPPN